MAFQLRFPPGFNRAVNDATDFSLLSAADKSSLYDHWDVEESSVFLIRTSHAGLLPWLTPLGAVDDPNGAPGDKCLDHHHLEALFLRAFSATSDVAVKCTGEWFVHPSRLSDALDALCSAGLDLSLPNDATASNAPTTLTQRINAVLSSGSFQLLPLRDMDMLPTVPTPLNPLNDMAVLWPSRVTFGKLVQPANNSLAPAADLLGLVGFRLHHSDREDQAAQFTIVSNAIVAPQLTGPMAHLGDESKPDVLADFILASAWPTPLQCMPFSFASTLGDVADRIDYLSADSAATVIQKRFDVLATHLPNVAPFVAGAPAPQAFRLAVGLADQLLNVNDTSSLAALFALNTHLEGKLGLLDIHDVRDKSPQERAAVLLAHADSQEVARETTTAPAPATDSSSTSSALGCALKYSREMSLYLLSPDVVAPLVLIPNKLAADGSPCCDETSSGLLALLETMKDSPIDQLRVLFARRNVFVTQALLSSFHHRSGEALFTIIAGARAHMVKYLSLSVVTEDDGSVKPHDLTFELDESFVKDFLAGKWENLNFHQHLLVRLHAHRSRSLAPQNVPKHKQWLTPTATATAKLATRLFAALGYQRHDAHLGLSPLLDLILAYIASSPMGIDHSPLGIKIADSALKGAARRWLLWTRSPPGTSAPSSFLEKDDPCFELLADAHKAQDDLFALSNAYPSIVSHLSRQTALGGGSGGGNGGNGSNGGGSPGAKPPATKKQKPANSKANAPRSSSVPSHNTQARHSTPPASLDSRLADGKKPAIEPKSLASKCSWSGRTLTFERQYFDASTKAYVDLQSDVLDIGAFCDATGTDFNRYCWPYVATIFLQSQAQNNAPQHGRNLAAARCKHFGSAGHTEAPIGKHEMPQRINELRQYFRRG